MLMKYEVNRIADELYVLTKLLDDEIQGLHEEDENDPISNKKALKHLSNEVFKYADNLKELAVENERGDKNGN